MNITMRLLPLLVAAVIQQSPAPAPPPGQAPAGRGGQGAQAPAFKSPEILPDKRIAFQVKFDSATPSNDFFNKMVGNNVLIDDLYALNGGGPR